MGGEGVLWGWRWDGGVLGERQAVGSRRREGALLGGEEISEEEAFSAPSRESDLGVGGASKKGGFASVGTGPGSQRGDGGEVCLGSREGWGAQCVGREDHQGEETAPWGEVFPRGGQCPLGGG